MPACPICKMHLKNNFCFKRHIKIHYENEHYQCEHCHKFYARKDNLRKHRKGCGKARRRPPSINPATDVSIDECSQSNEDQSEAPSTVPQVSPVALGDGQEHFQRTGLTSSYDADLQHIEHDESPAKYSTISQSVLSSSSGDWLSFPDGILGIDAMTSYDDLGRVHADAWMVATQNTPPCPEFLEDMVNKLRQNYRDIRIEGIMHLCLVCLTTRTPCYRPQNSVFNQEGFEAQFVPTIRCLDCTDQALFAVSPQQSLRTIKDHLNRPDHLALRLNRKHDAWLANNGGFSWPSIGQLAQSSDALSDQTLLMLAVKKHDVRVLGRLLNDGFKVEEKDSSQRSALHWACFLGRNDMAELLVRYGARLDEQDAESQTPVDLALHTSGVTVAMNLVQVLAQVQQQRSPWTCETPLALACRFDQLAVVEAMIKAGADVNERGVNSPLEIALRDATWPVVQLLLHNGAHANTISQQHRVLLRNKRDGFLVRGSSETDYVDAESKIMSLKGYALDLDASPSPTPSTGLQLTIPSNQPWLHRI